MDHRTAAPAAGLRHGALLYRTAREFTAGVLPFVNAGVDRGEAVLVAAAEPNLERLRARVDGASGHVTWAGLPAAGANPRRITAALRAFAAGQHGRPFRLVQEPAWPSASPDQLREALRHDALLNLALAGTPGSVLCTYDQRLGDRPLAAVRRTHPLAVQDGQWRRSGSYAPGDLIPADLDQRLPAPPPAAEVLIYREDQAAVRQFTAERAGRAGLAPDRITDLVIAVGELAANTLVHTRDPGTLAMWVAAGEVICQLRDCGQISDPLAGTARPDPADLSGGRGLWVVHQLCDLVEMRTEPAGTTFRLHMRVAPETGRADTDLLAGLAGQTVPCGQDGP